MTRAKYREEEVDAKCPKCGMHSKVKANNFFDTFYVCPNCKELIVVKKLKD